MICNAGPKTIIKGYHIVPKIILVILPESGESMKKRCVSIILILAILSSFIVVPTSAAGETRPSSSITGLQYDTNAVSYWDSKFSNSFVTDGVSNVLSAFTVAMWKDFMWYVMDNSITQVGSLVSLSALQEQAAYIASRLTDKSTVKRLYQSWAHDKFSLLYNALLNVTDPITSAFRSFWLSNLPSSAEVAQAAGEGWIVVDRYGSKLCRSNGAYPYYMEPEQAEGEAAAVLGGKWVDAAFRDGVPGLHLYSYRSTLETVADRLCDLGQTCGVQSWTYKNEKYWYILKERGSSVYADKRGRPYVVRQSSDYAVDKDQNYYAPGKDSGDTYNQQLVDLLTGILNAPRGDTVTQGDNSLYLEDGAIYDLDNRTYSFTATNSFNTTTNNYYTYNYSYTYHINYTSVTYIGTTAQYDEIYKYYYELPDGRYHRRSSSLY